MKEKVVNILKKSRKKTIEYVITNRLFLSYVVLSIIGTCIVREFTTGNFFSMKAFATDLAFILIIGSLGYFIKPEKQYAYFQTWLCVYTLCEIINTVYYKFYSSFASFGELATLGQTETVLDSIYDKLIIADFIFILFPLIFRWIHKVLKNSPYYNFINKIEKSKTMVVTTIIMGSIFLFYTLTTATGTDFSRLNKQWNRVYIVQRFGIIMYQVNDFVQTLTPKFSSMFGLEEAQEEFNLFFENEKYEHKNNKYTNKLEGKNIIFVHMESIQDFVMDLSFNGQELTPNLNKLAKSGMFFENFYPQISTGTSSDTEFTLLSSLMPSASGTVFVSYHDREYITIPKILAREGYKTFSMHGNFASMWNRNKAHPSLGYQQMYFKESFDYTKEDVLGLGINDSLFFEQAIPILENIEQENRNYMGTIITLSNHSPFTGVEKFSTYDLSTTFTKTDNFGNTKTVTTDYLSEKSIGEYLKSVHYADIALGEFINYIKSSDYFNDTVFVFYGDHDAKYSRKELNYLYNYDYETGNLKDESDPTYVQYDSFDHELNKKTPLIIWTKNNSLKNTFKGTISYPMGMIDVAPTILNMFGINNKYALGHDIFDIKNNNKVIFPNGNVLTNALYYNNSTGKYKTFKENEVLDEGYITELERYVETRLEVSNSIVVYDLLKGKISEATK